jgi:diacylglycerol kinase family enzyme
MSIAAASYPVRSVVVILNPVSGQGAAPDRRAQLEAALAAAGVRFDVRSTAHHPQPIQFDGNDMGSDRVLELEVAPGALQVMVPPRSAAT